ncbi:MAG: hypothetical protein HEQ32_05890 [Vampirovibrio sp.]
MTTSQTTVTVSPLKQQSQTTQVLIASTRIQSLDQVNFLNTVETTRSPYALQSRILEEATQNQQEATRRVQNLKNSQGIQKNALRQAQAIYLSSQDNNSEATASLWQAYTSDLSQVIQDEDNVYSQEFVVKALPEANTLLQYIPLSFTTTEAGDQEQLRQMLSYWHDQEDLLSNRLEREQKALSVANITIANAEAASPRVNPADLLK